jgi:hypothetical protein
MLTVDHGSESQVNQLFLWLGVTSVTGEIHGSEKPKPVACKDTRSSTARTERNGPAPSWIAIVREPALQRSKKGQHGCVTGGESIGGCSVEPNCVAATCAAPALDFRDCWGGGNFAAPHQLRC